MTAAAASTAPAAWQQGYPLDQLKELTRPFREGYKGYTFGAFGTPKERDIAEALKAGRLIYTREEGTGACVAAAVYHVTRQASQQADFAGRQHSITPGTLQVQHIAAVPGCEDRAAHVLGQLIARYRARRPHGAVTVELHEENGPLRDALVDAASLHYSYTKILASSDLRGVYCAAMPPAAPLPPTELLSIAEISADFITPDEQLQIVAEIEAAGSAQWAQHYSTYNKRQSWTAFALRGYQPADPGFIIKPAEMSKKWKAENPALCQAACADTVLAPHFPVAMRVAARLPGAKDRIRLMRLAPGKGELARHADITDREAGTRDGAVTRLHIPLRTHQQVIFEGWGPRGDHLLMNFAERGLYYLDQRKPHRVTNKSPVDRLHLVVDVYAGPELRQMLDTASHASRSHDSRISA